MGLGVTRPRPQNVGQTYIYDHVSDSSWHCFFCCLTAVIIKPLWPLAHSPRELETLPGRRISAQKPSTRGLPKRNTKILRCLTRKAQGLCGVRAAGVSCPSQTQRKLVIKHTHTHKIMLMKNYMSITYSSWRSSKHSRLTQVDPKP